MFYDLHKSLMDFAVDNLENVVYLGACGALPDLPPAKGMLLICFKEFGLK